MIVEINGKKADLAGYLPFKIKDWKKLEVMGITMEALQKASWDHMSKLILYVVARANPDIKEEDIDELEIRDPAITQIMEGIGGEKKKIDRPS